MKIKRWEHSEKIEPRSLKIDKEIRRRIRKPRKRKTRVKSKDNLKKSLLLDDSNFDISYSVDTLSDIFGPLIGWLISPVFTPAIFAFIGGYIAHNLGVYIGFILSPLIIVSCIFIKSLIIAYQKVHSVSTQNNTYWLSKNEYVKVRNWLPFNLTEPEIESTEWINDILERIWPKIQSYMNSTLSKILGPDKFLDSLFGTFVSKLRLRLINSSLGTAPPNITGVHVKRRGVKMEDLIIDSEITFNSDLNILIMGKHFIKAGIDFLLIRFRFRTIFTPLFREKPSIGCIYLSLLNVPKIDWHFIGILRILNFNLLKLILANLFYFWIGIPSKLTVNIAKFIPSREMKLKEPIGLIRVDINDAINLPKTNIRCCKARLDAFCVVRVGKERRWTHVIDGTDSPEWNRSFSFLVHGSIESLIQFLVYDDDIDEDRLIGIFSTTIHTFSHICPAINGRECAAPLRHPDTGKMIQNGQAKISFRVSWFELTKERSKQDLSDKLFESKLPVAILSVLIESATGLETTLKKIQTPELRSLVRITVGNSTQVTSVKERTGYPIWEEALHFLLFNPKLEEIRIELVDMYYILEKRFFLLIGAKRKKQREDWVKLSEEGVVLGHVSLPVVDVLNSNKMKLEGNYRLQGYTEDAYIRLLMVIRITEYSSIVEANSRKARLPFPDIINERVNY